MPNIIGALSLNQSGQDQLAARPSIIPALFAIFTSEKHLKVLIDKENAAAIGGSIDELIRHHPNLRTIVFESLISTLKKIQDLGSTFVPPEDIQQFYRLSLNAPQEQEDVDMKDEATVQNATEGPAAEEAGENESIASEDPQAKTHDNPIINFIDVIGRVCSFLNAREQRLTYIQVS